MKYSKNVTLKASNIETIEGFMNKTKQNFSATLNIIIEQWDKITLEMQKVAREQEQLQHLKKIDTIKKAKVIK